AVVVAHDKAGCGAWRRRTGGSCELREAVHQSAAESLLLRRVVVILIGGGGFRSIEAEGVRRAGGVSGRVQEIGIVEEQTVGIAVDGGSIRPGFEFGLISRVGCVGVGSKVGIKRNVFLEDDNQVFDRSSGRVSITMTSRKSWARPGTCNQ